MNVMSRFALRSMKANRKWTITTLIGIIISTAMISAVSTFCASFTELMRNEAIAENGNWHAMVSEVRMRDVPTFESSKLVDKFSLSSEVGYAKLPDSKNTSKPYLFIRQFDEKSAQSFPIELLEGRMPQNDQELALPEHLKTNGGVNYKIGDTLTLDIGKRETPDGVVFDQQSSYQGEPTYENGEYVEGETFVAEQTRAYTVVGIIARPKYEPSWAPGYTALSFLDTKALGPDDTVTVVLLARNLNRHFFDDVTALAGNVGLDASHVEFNSEVLRYSGVVANEGAQNMIYGFAVIFIAIIMAALGIADI